MKARAYATHLPWHKCVAAAKLDGNHKHADDGGVADESRRLA
jgi:hypothetical protein